MEEKEYSVLEIVKLNLRYWKILLACMFVFGAAFAYHQYKTVKPVVVHYEELQQMNGSFYISEFNGDGIVERLTTVMRIIESYDGYEEFLDLTGYEMSYDEYKEFVNFDDTSYIALQGFYVSYPNTYGNMELQSEDDAKKAILQLDTVIENVCNKYLGQRAVTVVETGYPTVYTHASATTPTTQADVRTAIVKGGLAGACLGLAIAIVIITIIYMIGTVSKNAKEIEAGLESPVIAFIRNKKNKKEEIKKVRIYMTGKEQQIINYIPFNEKYAMGAIELAQNYAETGAATLFINCSNELEGENSKFTEYLRGMVDITQVEPEKRADNLDVIERRKDEKDQMDVFATDQLKNFVVRMKEKYQYIIINSPDLKIYADAYEIAGITDANVIGFKRRGISATDLYDIKNTIKVNGLHLAGAVIYGN